MKKRLILVLFAAALALLLPGRGIAETVFFDDFENVAAVSFPSADDADPNAIIGEWEVAEDPDDSLQVIDNGEPGAFGPGENYVRLHRWQGGNGFGANYLWAHFSRTISKTETFSITFGVYGERGGGLNITLVGPTSYPPVTMRILPGGSFMYDEFSFPTDPGLKISLGEWHEVRIDVDYPSFQFDLSVDGRKAEGLGFANTIPPYVDPGISSVSFGMDVLSTPGIWYIDSVKVEAGSTECAGLMAEDMNGDCYVDFADFARLADNWLECNFDPDISCP